MRKICIVLNSDLSIPGGAHVRVRAMVNGLRKNGFDVNLVAPVPKAKLPNDLHGVNIHTVPVTLKNSLVCRIYRTVLLAHKARKIQKHTGAILQFEHALLGGYAAATGSSGFVLDMHDIGFDSAMFENVPLQKKIQRILYHLEKMAVKRALKIIVVSNPMKDFIISEWNVPEEKIVVIPNGYSESKLRMFQDVGEEDGIVSFIGRLHPKLDIDKFIGVGKLLKNIGGSLYIIGDGPIRNLLEQKIKKNDLINNVVLTGHLPDIEAYTLLAKSRVAIFPLKISKSINTEAMNPVKVFDYAALGKAMVLDDLSEMCKIFKESNAALVSDPTDHEKFIENVRILLDDKNLRKRLGSNAKKLVKDYTWEKQGEKIVKMYKTMEK